MEFIYNIKGNEIEVSIPGLTEDPVKLSRDWVDELTKKVMEKFGLDYDTAFGIAVYLGYLKTTWVKP